MPLRVLATNAPARYGALRYGALPVLPGAGESVLASMWFATAETINADIFGAGIVASIASAATVTADLQTGISVSAGISSSVSINTVLQAPICISGSIASAATVSAAFPCAVGISAAIASATTINAVLNVDFGITETTEVGQLFLTFSTPDNRLVQLGFNARYINQEVWRFVGITAGNRQS